MNKDLKIFKMLGVLLGDLKKNDDFYGNTISVVSYKHDIVSIGLSNKKSHPLQKKYGKTQHHIYLHAEINAIYKASKKLTEKEFMKSSLYVARIKHKMVEQDSPIFGLAKPCEGCASAIMVYRFKNVLYTIDSEMNDPMWERFKF